MLLPGDRVDVWVVDKQLGSGGMGAVYRCHNFAAPRILAAVKVLDPALGGSATLRARFVREAELLFSLDHPNIVKVRNVRMDASPPFIEMGFVEGENLEQILRRGPLPPGRVVELGRQLAEALAFIHGQGVAHRDIKPSNLIVSGDHLTLVDFGIAAEAAAADITSAGQRMGTVSYTPPEWGSGARVDPYQWDLYGLGQVLCEALTGKAAFPYPVGMDARQAMFAVMARKREQGALDPGPGVPADLRELIGELTEPLPAARLGSAREAAARLGGVELARDPPAPRERVEVPPASPTLVAHGPAPTFELSNDDHLAPTVPEPPPASPGRGRKVGGLVGLVALAAVLLAALLPRSPDAPPPPAGRELSLRLQGLPEGIPARVSLGEGPAQDISSGALRLPGVGLGPAALRLEVGGDCARGCLVLERVEVVGAGEGPIELTWEIPPPQEGQIRVQAPQAPAARVGRVGGEAQDLARGEGVIGPLSAGRHALWAQAGRCPAPPPCEGACPAGCVEERAELQIPWEGGEVVWTLGLEAPPVAVATGAVATGAVAAANDAAATPTATLAAKPGTLVRRDDFARFLEGQPDWLAEAAIARGDAGSGYLRDWTGATPPSPGSAAATNVSWAAAAAYCKSRGGLAGVDDPPTSWEESGGAPWLEHRQREGKPAWRRSDGASSDAAASVSRTEANLTLGFRCRR